MNNVTYIAEDFYNIHWLVDTGTNRAGTCNGIPQVREPTSPDAEC